MSKHHPTQKLWTGCKYLYEVWIHFSFVINQETIDTFSSTELFTVWGPGQTSGPLIGGPCVCFDAVIQTDTDRDTGNPVAYLWVTGDIPDDPSALPFTEYSIIGPQVSGDTEYTFDAHVKILDPEIGTQLSVEFFLDGTSVGSLSGPTSIYLLCPYLWVSSWLDGTTPPDEYSYLNTNPITRIFSTRLWDLRFGTSLGASDYLAYNFIRVPENFIPYHFATTDIDLFRGEWNEYRVLPPLPEGEPLFLEEEALAALLCFARA